jgi:hypothetical protein
MNEKTAILMNLLIVICVAISSWSLVTQIDNSEAIARQEEIVKTIQQSIVELKSEDKEIHQIKERLAVLEVKGNNKNIP